MKKRYIKQSPRKLENSRDPRMMLVRKYLDRYGIRVGQWYPHYLDEKGKVANITYQACFDTHRVFIPLPVDDYALYVCLHEIGHLVTGEARYAYLQEYKAEQWAIQKLKQHGYYKKNFEREAKQYVVNIMYEDILFRGLQPHKVRPNVLDWIDRPHESIKRGAIRWINKWQRAEVNPPLTVDDGHATNLGIAAKGLDF
jgi:hypothetical protein